MPRYSSIVLEHARDPRNGGELPSANAIGDASLDGRAPRVRIFLRCESDKVSDATFQTFGCGVTVASGSVLTEMIKGRECQECRELQPADLAKALGGLPPDKAFCADLVIKALHDALDQWKDADAKD